MSRAWLHQKRCVLNSEIVFDESNARISAKPYIRLLEKFAGDEPAIESPAFSGAGEFQPVRRETLLEIC